MAHQSKPAKPQRALHPANLPEAPGWPIHPAMVTSGPVIPGFIIVRSLGIVQGLTVRSPGLGGGFTGSLQAIGSGNVTAFEELCGRARHEAFLKMMQDAVRYGANGIIGFRYDTIEISQGLAEVLAYGTAVWAEASA